MNYKDACNIQSNSLVKTIKQLNHAGAAAKTEFADYKKDYSHPHPAQKQQADKFAMGGVAKIRLDESNANGTQKKLK